METPLATPDLPGTGGAIGSAPDDFVVCEQAAYEPSGEGEHCFCRLRKKGITSYEAIGRLAQALGVKANDVGMAGMKDRHAVTEQWLSLPGIDPAAARAVALPDLEVLEAHRHPSKLRTGHLRGNHFRIRIVGVDGEAAARAEAILKTLSAQGAHHVFGPQRFGRDGQNPAAGRRMLREERVPRDRRQRRLLLSALQSELFNDYLGRRLALAPLTTVLAGELMQRTDSGGVFAAEDLDEVGARLTSGAVFPSGPMFGPKLMRPAPQSPTFALEEATLEAAGLSLEAFARWKRLAPGGRRSLLVKPTAVTVEAAGSDALWAAFFLPPGAYATVILREVIKRPFAELRAPFDRPV